VVEEFEEEIEEEEDPANQITSKPTMMDAIVQTDTVFQCTGLTQAVKLEVPWEEVFQFQKMYLADRERKRALHAF
jgi:hypothetical protein